MNYSKSEIKKSVINVIAFIKQYKRIPQTVWVGKTNYSIKNFLALTELVNAKKAIEEFKKKNKRLPNYVTICEVQMPKDIYTKLFSLTSTSSSQNTTKNTTSTSQTRFVSSPYLLDHNWIKQDYDASCALNSLQESFYKLTRKTVSESTMFNLGYTNSRSGTGHEGIKAIVNWFNKKYGMDISVSFKNLSDFGKTSKEQWTNIGKLMSKSNVAVFFHIYYRNGGSSCTSAITSQDHGHYEICDIVNVETMYVRALNSLSGGYLQDRKISVQECFMKKISQPSVIILTKK